MKTMMPVMLLMLAIVAGAIAYVAQGIAMHNRVATEEATFHGLQGDYFLKSKAVRDGAETGSALNRELVQIQNYPSELLRLKLVGVGKILTGIFGMLFAILIALVMMPVRLAKLLKQNKS